MTGSQREVRKSGKSAGKSAGTVLSDLFLKKISH